MASDTQNVLAFLKEKLDESSAEAKTLRVRVVGGGFWRSATRRSRQGAGKGRPDPVLTLSPPPRHPPLF
jgi:hypothetical protein